MVLWIHFDWMTARPDRGPERADRADRTPPGCPLRRPPGFGFVPPVPTSPAGKMGVSHLLEHMVFKGTERRTARELALELEVRGGSARRLHRPRPDQLSGPRPRRGPAPGPRRPDRSGPPPAAPRPATWPWSGTWCWKRSTPSRTLPTTWSSNCSREALARAPLRLFDPGYPGDRRARFPPVISRRVHGAGYYPGNCVIAAGGPTSITTAVLDGLEGEGLVRGARPAHRLGRR